MNEINAYAHCDGPCGIYDPASVRITGEAVLSMTKKMLELNCPDTSNSQAMASYLNTMSSKVEVSIDHANELMDMIKKIHEIFWETKGREVPWITAG